MTAKTKQTADDDAEPGRDVVADARDGLAEAKRRLSAIETEQRAAALRLRENVSDRNRAMSRADAAELNRLEAERADLVARHNQLIDDREAAIVKLGDAAKATAAARRGPLLDVETAERLLDGARREVEQLEAERADSPQQIAQALTVGDAIGLLQGRARAEALPALIVSARISALHAEAKYAEAMAAVMPARIDEAAELLPALEAALEAAKAALAEAVRGVGGLREERSRWRQRAAQCRQEADEIVRSEAARAAAPVVRSLRHAPAGV